MKEIKAVILAAGQGTRMKSDMAKVLHKLCGKPLLAHVLKAVEGLNIGIPYAIIGYQADKVREQFKNEHINFVLQKEQLGTGHAVMQVEQFFNNIDATVLVLNGDMPLITTKVLKKLIEYHNQKRASATVLTAIVDDPSGYGRIVRDPHHDLEKIVEEKDGSLGEVEIKEINTGTYCFDGRDLFSALHEVRPENVAHEYYLTDIIKILREKRKRVCAFSMDDSSCALGINTKEQLLIAEKILSKRKN
jgi:bifunctional UDP-N-acetylglucosamine pyrophosphorylase/glucosamine-1-phosphate N-acetyltransferase